MRSDKKELIKLTIGVGGPFLLLANKKFDRNPNYWLIQFLVASMPLDP